LEKIYPKESLPTRPLFRIRLVVLNRKRRKGKEEKERGQNEFQIKWCTVISHPRERKKKKIQVSLHSDNRNTEYTHYNNKI